MKQTKRPPTKRRRLVLVLLLLLAAASLSLIYTAGCVGSKIGHGPPPEDIRQYAELDNHSDGKFVNLEPPVWRMGKRGAPLGMLRFFRRSPNAPDHELPAVPLDRESFAAEPDEFSVRWLGHSTLIFELAGVRFITDPVFGNAAPLPRAVQRYAPSPLARNDLPRLDFVLISHDHYDHLEHATIRFLRNRDMPFVVPLGVGARLRGWGIAPERIHELNWDQSITVNGVEIIAQTARHFSGRTFRDRNTTLWNAYVIRGGGRSVFFGADGGYGNHFRETGERFGPFDLTCLEIDAWSERWPNTHLFPEEVIQAHRDLRGNLLLPIHWGVFDLATHPWDASIRQVAEHARRAGIPLLTPVMGQKTIPGETTTQPWWENPQTD